MSFAVGSLVKARNREWVVLPESEGDLVVVRPLGGSEDEVTGIYLPLEKVEPATFDLPELTQIGDHRSSGLLRKAIQLGFRSSAGPFRAFGKIAVEPRAYQLVPLLMALKMDPVRMLIADDVGIGKTVEACLIGRELLDRGEIKRVAVLCPPHLAEQWQGELQEKFNIHAELVLASTARRLESGLGMRESLFDVYPHVVVSMDFIKSEKRRNDFLRTCPEFVIVDEAHTCAYAQGMKGGGRHQRHQLLKGLAEDPERHLLLVTATPHSGKEEAFRSLLSLLKPEFKNLPDDLTGKHNEGNRRGLAQYLVQRTRADIRHYLKEETPFPERLDYSGGDHYNLSTEYRKLFVKALDFTRETVKEEGSNQFRQRVKWWSALALLRALASSPAAAATTLRNRSPMADCETGEEADEMGRRAVMDEDSSEDTETMDATSGTDTEWAAGEDTATKRRLRAMAREAEGLRGEKDEKLKGAAKLVKELLRLDCSPILFCRFIETAEYLCEELRARLPKSVEIDAVTGKLAPADREERIAKLIHTEKSKKVLVCTDCLSEGINLQNGFDAVVHYDLSWSPTRHEQRVGRVDRYGQPKKEIRVVTYYGTDNQIDGIVLDVLLKKHKNIQSSLGVSIPVPANTNDVLEAIFEGLLLKEQTGHDVGQMSFMEQLDASQRVGLEKLHKGWDSLADREKRSRSMFAQESIGFDHAVVAQELEATRVATGAADTVGRFVEEAVNACGGVVARKNGKVILDIAETPAGLRDSLVNYGKNGKIPVTFGQVAEGAYVLHRTHPIVEGLATFVMDVALDAQADPEWTGAAKRAGVIVTDAVQKRTTLLLIRNRYHIISKRKDKEEALLAESCMALAYQGKPENAQWLEPEQAQELENAKPRENIEHDRAKHFLGMAIQGYGSIRPYLETKAKEKGEELLDAHRRVREAAKAKGITYRIETKLPPDVLGVYVYLPA